MKLRVEEDRPRRAWHVLGAIGLVALGVLVGRATGSATPTVRPPSEARLAPAARTTEPPVQVRSPKPALPKSEPALSPACQGDSRAELSAEQVRARSRDFMSGLRRRLNRMRLISPQQRPEDVIGRLQDYMFGWSEALGSSPEFTTALAEQVQDAVCDQEEGANRDASLMLSARLVRMLPELASEETFDCFFAAATGENPVVWEGIAAWKRSELPKPDAIEELERSATKPQTLHHLKGSAELAAEMPERGLALDARGLPLPGQLVLPPGGKAGFPPGTL